MAVTYIGAGATFNAKATTASFTISTGAVSSGDVVILQIGCRAASSITTITVGDTGSNTWTSLVASPSIITNQVFLYGATMAAAGTFTITVSVTPSATVVAAATDHFSGVSLTLDGATTGNSGSTTSVTIPAFTTTVGGDLILATVGVVNASQTLSALGTGWAVMSTASSIGGSGGSNNSIAGAFLIQTTAGSTSFSASIPNASSWLALAAPLEATVAAAPGPPRELLMVPRNQSVIRSSLW